MTNDDKVCLTIRITNPIDQQLSKASKGIGISKNAFILMALNEKLRGGMTLSDYDALGRRID